MRGALARAVIAVALAALPIAAATPAVAASTCAVDETLVPPALRPYLDRCSTTAGGQGDFLLQFDGWDLYAPIVRALGDDGWVVDPAVSFLGFGFDIQPITSPDVPPSPVPTDATVIMTKGGDSVDIRWFDPSEPAGGLPDGFVGMTSLVIQAQAPFPLDAADQPGGGGQPEDPGEPVNAGYVLDDPSRPTTIDEPSALGTLRTIPQSLLSPPQVAILCGAAVILTLVIGWPGSLLNGVVSSRYDQLFGWTEKGLPKRIRDALKKTQPRWLMWLGFVAAAIVAGFADPKFGFNLMSLRMLGSAFLAFLVFNVAGWAIVKLVVRRIAPTAKPVVNFRWGSLLIVLGAVLIARLLEFQPGVIFGLVAGLTYALTLTASRKAIVVLVGSGFALAAALVAWIAFSILAPAVGGNAGLLFIAEFFSGVTIEGVSTLPLALLPLLTLDGADLLAWKRWVWAVAYAVGVAAFMFVLLTVPGSFAAFPGDFARWLILFAIYALVAVGAWAVHAALERRKQRSG